MPAKKAHRELRGALQRLRRRKAVLDSTTGMALCAALTAALWCLGVWLEAAFPFGVRGRTVWMLLLATLGVASFAALVFRPLVKWRLGRPSDREIADRIGEAFPGVHDRLSNALDVYQQRTRDSGRASDSLASLALETAAEEVRGNDGRPVFSKQLRGTALKALGIVLAFAAVAALFPAWRHAAGRMVHFTKSFVPPPDFQADVIPGNIRIIEGENVTVQIKFRGRTPDSVTLALRREREEKIRLAEPYRHRFSELHKSLDYRIETVKWVSPWYRIEVIQRPEIRSLRVTVRPPTYAALPDFGSDSGNIEALAGSRVEIDVAAQKPLARAFVSFENGREAVLSVSSFAASGGFTVNADDRYRIQLEDTSGIANISVPYSIRITPDLYPVVRLTAPGKDVEVDEAMKVPIRVEAEDDYGLSGAGLRYWIRRSGDSTAADTAAHGFNPQGSPRSAAFQYDWDLKTLDLFPEDVVYYLAEAADNDRIGGPKRARTRTFSIRFPSVNELFNRVEAAQTGQVEAVESMKKESGRIKESLDKLTDSFKSDGQWTWDKQQALNETAEKNQTLGRTIDSLKTRIDPTADDLERQKLDAEIVDQVREIRNLFDQIAPEELKEASRRLQDMLGKMDPAKIEKTLESMRMSEEDIHRALDRSLSLLKRIQIETELAQTVRHAEAMERDQKALNKSISQNPEKNLSRDQERIGRETESLSKELETLSSHMQATPGMPTDDLQKAVSRMSRERLGERIQASARALRAGQFNKAQNEGGAAEETLSGLSNDLASIQNQMQSQKTERLARSMLRSQIRLIDISKEQERQMRESGPDVDEQTAILRATEQAADSLAALSNQTMTLSPELGRSLGRAQSEIRQSIQNGENPSGGQHGLNALTELNRSVILLGEARSSLGRPGGKGAGSFFGGLDQMSQSQLALQRELESLLASGMDDGGLAKLAAEQEALRRRLAQMLEKYGEQGAGRLSPLLDEMDKTAEDLRAKRGREGVKRQEKILSRLLEAQHAMREQSYDETRKAKTGTNVSRPGPAEVQTPASDLAERIRWDLMRLPEEGYSQEYQALIRRYFDAVMNEAQ